MRRLRTEDEWMFQAKIRGSRQGRRGRDSAGTCRTISFKVADKPRPVNIERYGIKWGEGGTPHRHYVARIVRLRDRLLVALQQGSAAGAQTLDAACAMCQWRM
jgi:hypothetical protein